MNELQPEDVALTLVGFREILEGVRVRIAEQGRIVDDRLLEKERNLERVIKEMSNGEET